MLSPIETERVMPRLDDDSYSSVVVMIGKLMLGRARI